jgi:short-subunit dehydrogenase involved in D-alanine esterification of teichoic acids
MNSGIQRKADFSDPASLDLDSIDLEMNTNYLTWIRFFKYYTPFFQAKKEKTAFVFVSSGLGLVPMSRCANYCATKVSESTVRI